MTTRIPRIAVGGFMLESNAHAPVATREEFEGQCDVRGEAFEHDWRSPHPRVAGTLLGFVAAMDRAGPWQPVPLLHAHVGASGPVDQAYFDALVDELCERLRAARTPQEANDAVLRSLRPAGFTPSDPTGSMHYDKRLNNTLALAGGEPMYSPPMNPMMMRLAQGQPAQPGAGGPYGGMRPPMSPMLPQMAQSPMAPPITQSPGMGGGMQPYAPSTPFRDPSLDEMQLGNNTATAAAPGGQADWAKVASALGDMAKQAAPKDMGQNIPMPQAQMNRPQVQGLPQFASNQMLLQLAKARAGGQRPMPPMAGLLGGV
jgi:hypothetical protein